MNTTSEILDRQYQKLSKLATIIGRYKGSMGVFSDELKYFADSQRLSQEQKYRIRQIADLMEKNITDNEALWDEAYGITKKGDDTVELERVQSDIVELERA